MYQVSVSHLRDLLIEALAGDPVTAGFDVHYQPIVQFEDHATIAVEALTRWWHPIVGNVCPTLFVGIAESLELIGIVDDFALDRACADAAALARVFGRAVDVHVNVSASRLGRCNLERTVARTLERHGVQPGRLVLEITETAEIVDLSAAVRAIGRIREQGVRIALDDFGAGFNWLSRLHELPIDIVKLDAVATEVEIDTKSAGPVCEALLGLCDQLQLPVIAEGVETGWQAEALARLGCCIGQGYLFGVPEPLPRLFVPQTSALLRSA